MRYEVLLTEGAERDLEELYDYIAGFDSPANADYVLDQLMKVVEGLATFPERGAYPMELLALGTREYRQAFFRPYRVIYRLMPSIHLPDCGWQTRYADPAYAGSPWRIDISLPSV